jgi:hypothetical protein
MTPTLRSAVQNRIKVGIFAGGVAGVLGLVLALNACDGEVAGCRFRSVDRAAYVAKNDAVLRSVPVYPGSKLISDEAWGMHAGNSCGLNESGPPYASYWTTRRYTVPSDTPKGAITRYYRRVLAASWRWTGYTVPDPGQPAFDSTFQRGDARLYVQEFPADEWSIQVDYAGFANEKEHWRESCRATSYPAASGAFCTRN